MYRFESAWANGYADSEEALLPVVPVTIVAGDGTPWHTDAIVDSGADRTLIPAEALELFSVSYNDLEVVGLARAVTGDSFEVRQLPAQVSLRIPGGDILVRRRAPSRFEVTDPFAHCVDVAEPRRYAHSLPLVGRNDFFTVFRVRFRWQAGVIEVEA